jgi:hypothetical protein
METYLAIRNDVPTELFVWGGVSAVVLTAVFILASKAIEWLRNRKHPHGEHGAWR